MTPPLASEKRPRITEVAAAAGVSITTVSHTLNGKGRISEPTRAHVRKVATELGYRTSANARSLGGGRCSILALRVSLVGDSPASFVDLGYFTRLLNAATATALGSGFALITLPSHAASAADPVDFSADGMIAIDPTPDDLTIRYARQLGPCQSSQPTVTRQAQPPFNRQRPLARNDRLLGLSKGVRSPVRSPGLQQRVENLTSGDRLLLSGRRWTILNFASCRWSASPPNISVTVYELRNKER